MSRSASAARGCVLVLLLLASMVVSSPPAVAQTTPPGERVPAPQADHEVEIRRGNQVIRVRPLKTITMADGHVALMERLIVGFRDGVNDAERTDVHRQAGRRGAMNAKAAGKVGRKADAVDVPGAASLESAIQAYQADPRVEYAEPDYVMSVQETPNDPQFSLQWGMEQIRAPAAWSVTHGSAADAIAILDTGIYEEGASLPNGYLGHADLNGKVLDRRDFTGSPYGADDYHGHGTHVAGIASASTNNDIGVAGVGYNARLLNGKVCNESGQCPTSWVVNGIYWAADNSARVINMSLGGIGSCTTSYQDAISYAWMLNVVVVASAGNNNSSSPFEPASCTNVLAVASTDATDTRSSFSNYGTWVDVAAPGGRDTSGNSILSASYVGDYVYKAGTSMAAPHVAGMAGLLWGTGRYASAQAVVDDITSTADRIAGTGTYWQYGRINALAAVAIPTFADVPKSYWAWDQIETLYATGITGGCAQNPMRYCPERNVTRAEMAVFLDRVLGFANPTPPATAIFADVPPHHWAFPFVEQFYQLGITQGCGVTSAGQRLYCPDRHVTRAELAVFLLRAKYGGAYSPPPAQGIFDDVPITYWAAAWIEKLYADGITRGCGQRLYCPERNATRADMAVFLVRTFSLTR